MAAPGAVRIGKVSKRTWPSEYFFHSRNPQENQILKTQIPTVCGKTPVSVTPAKAGVQTPSLRKQGTIEEEMDSRFHGKPWIPASAGMTEICPERLFQQTAKFQKAACHVSDFEFWSLLGIWNSTFGISNFT
jgi:hypothetical protein